MPKLETLDLGRFEVKLGDYSVGPASAIHDHTILACAQEYRRNASSRMMPLGKDDLRKKLPQGEYHLSRKVDGEFCVLIYQAGQAFCINPGGTVRLGLPWMTKAAQCLEKAGIQSARVAGELYYDHPSRRPRVHDVTKVARGPKSEDDLQRLRFAPFDIIEWDGQTAAENYASTFQSLESVFAAEPMVCPVETVVVKNPDEISRHFDKWVEGEQAEGLVLRSDEAGLFKVKPRHTLDVAVIGFTESTDDRQGMLHDLLVAVMRGDGTMQVLTRVGGGFSDDQRRELLSDLKDMVVDSEYVEVNSDYVAYQMVRPEWVVEISCLDLISQTTRGGTVNRMVIQFDESAGRYEVVRRMPLATVISPQFVRRREDKKVEVADIRATQIGALVEVPMEDADARSYKLPKARLLKREVFTKVLKGETMVRKFVLIETNKAEASDEFPAFVVHYTDFSPNRKEPLQREVLICNSLEQGQALFLSLRQKNVKKGWSEVNAS